MWLILDEERTTVIYLRGYVTDSWRGKDHSNIPQMWCDWFLTRKGPQLYTSEVMWLILDEERTIVIYLRGDVTVSWRGKAKSIAQWHHHGSSLFRHIPWMLIQIWILKFWGHVDTICFMHHVDLAIPEQCSWCPRMHYPVCGWSCGLHLANTSVTCCNTDNTKLNQNLALSKFHLVIVP